MHYCGFNKIINSIVHHLNWPAIFILHLKKIILFLFFPFLFFFSFIDFPSPTDLDERATVVNYQINILNIASRGENHIKKSNHVTGKGEVETH